MSKSQMNPCWWNCPWLNRRVRYDNHPDVTFLFLAWPTLISEVRDKRIDHQQEDHARPERGGFLRNAPNQILHRVGISLVVPQADGLHV